MEVKLLAPDEIAAWEGRLRPFIESVCAKSRGRYAPHHMLEWARKGEWQIWLVLDEGAISAVCATEIILFPTGMKGLAFRFCTGRGRHRWQHRLADVEAWGKAQGCELAEGVMRIGWWRILRHFGWLFTHVFLEKSL